MLIAAGPMCSFDRNLTCASGILGIFPRASFSKITLTLMPAFFLRSSNQWK
jgi:hypothetical protein